MPEENEDAMRDPRWFPRPPLARQYDEVLSAPIPEHLVSLSRPQSGGALRRILARILNWRSKER
jgi:hypothetical protein